MHHLYLYLYFKWMIMFPLQTIFSVSKNLSLLNKIHEFKQKQQRKRRKTLKWEKITVHGACCWVVAFFYFSFNQAYIVCSHLISIWRQNKTITLYIIISHMNSEKRYQLSTCVLWHNRMPQKPSMRLFWSRKKKNNNNTTHTRVSKWKN